MPDVSPNAFPRFRRWLVPTLAIGGLLLGGALLRVRHAHADPLRGVAALPAPGFALGLDPVSQTAAFLRPLGEAGFGFTPEDRWAQRQGDGYVQLGDLSLRLRVGGRGEWRNPCTWAARKPVRVLPAGGGVLAAADLGPTLGDCPLAVERTWQVVDGHLVLRFTLRNPGPAPVEIGALGIPMVFNAIIEGRSLEEAHRKCSLTDPSIGQDGGYVQVTRLTGKGPVLLVVPEGKTPLEAWNPLVNRPIPGRPTLDPPGVFWDRTPRGTGFEGFHEWMVHTRAYAEKEWGAAQGWNPATAVTLAPGEARVYGVRFALAPEVRAVERTLAALKRPVAVGLPGYVLPQDQEGELFLSGPAPVRALEVEPRGALALTREKAASGAWEACRIQGRTRGRCRLTVTYGDGTVQTLNYLVIKPAAEAVADLGRFLTSRAWFTDEADPFGRAPSVMTYDREKDGIITQDKHAWVCGLGDEGGDTWLAGAMKLMGQPDPDQLAKYETFVDKVVWGNLQYKDGPLRFGIKRSLFYYEPSLLPAGYYRSDVDWTTWMSWNRKHILEVPRTYNYPHVTALYWSLYRVARGTHGLVTHHPWTWYLAQAAGTAEAMCTLGTDYLDVGLMEGSVFVELLKDLQREGMMREAAILEARMKKRADLWRGLEYPFGSEMAWDSTGQEEVYAWTRHFGDAAKARVCVDSILGFMPAIPHWGYNGCARRFWDFIYGGGRIGRIERMIHHYGSSLNAIPLLTEYRDHPDDFHLLRVGHAGSVGPLANIDGEGFPSMGFHSFPDTLKWDPVSGDYGSAFFGHALTAGAYLVDHPEFGWQGFGGNVRVQGTRVSILPRDAFRQRVYLAPMGLWITLSAGHFEAVELDVATGHVRLGLAPADAHTSRARLHVEQAARPGGAAAYVAPAGPTEAGETLVELGRTVTWVRLGKG